MAPVIDIWPLHAPRLCRREPDHDGCNLLTMADTMIMRAASRVLAEAISRRAGAASQLRLPAPQ